MSDKKIIRVFPRWTRATPTDEDMRVGCLPTFFDEADEIHISVTFTWDMREAERLAREWEYVAAVQMGGPATGIPGEDFVPGMYLKKGYVITSRGCPNNCWFCEVWRREGKVRELPITDGWIVTDDNLLACSKPHITGVFEMLYRQPEKPIFVGGLEAARLEPWHVEYLAELNPQRMYFAYDTPDDFEPLVAAAKLCEDADLNHSHRLACYVLIGYPKDTIQAADARLRQVVSLGIMPFAMLYRTESGLAPSRGWAQFQREWANPVIIGSKMKDYKSK